MYTVYQHKNKINNKVYIGITKQIPEKRWGINGYNYKTSPHFYSAIQKYGWENFEHNILFEGLTKEDACLKEKELIIKFNSMDRRYGYNSTSGGETFTVSPEIRIKMSQAMKGNKNGLGHPCSEEKRQKISNAQKNKTLTEEHRKKLSEAAKIRHTPCSDETKRKISNSYPNKKKVYCKELNCVYSSVHECARQLNLHATTISKVCKGKLNTTGNYHFIYYDDIIKA